MCGIIGYIGKANSINKVLTGLKNLEYRGYDSWGIASKSNKIKIIKDIGKISNIKNINSNANIIIGHTRWATHGRVSKTNAHPHCSNNRQIAVVHNGIIENYQELKKKLIKLGFKFYSDTDTEVIPILIEHYMNKYNFFNAFKEMVKELEGNYAIVAIHNNKNEILGVIKGSPLVAGIGNNELFIASDIPAFLNYTKKVIYLEEEEIIRLNNKIFIFNINKNVEVKRPISSIEWNAEQAKKGNFDHFMLKEISEQTETINRSLNQDINKIKSIADEFGKARDIFFVACGSSYHACLSARYIFSKVAKTPINVILGSEFPNHEYFLDSDSLIVAVSQSGETADVLESIKIAKKRNSKIISIVNVIGSSLSRLSDKTIFMNAGPEICVLSTKTYTSQLVILTLLAYALAGKYNEGKEILKDLIKFVYYLTSKHARDYIKSLAEKLRYTNHIFTIGRDLQYPTALEAALKIKEVSYIHAEGFAGGELKHGTIALIEHGTPCIVFVSNSNKKEIISNAMEIKSRGGFIIGVAEENNNIFDFFLKVRDAGYANSICQIIPIQILAYKLAILRGHDPDKPRNLAKSVTVK